MGFVRHTAVPFAGRFGRRRILQRPPREVKRDFIGGHVYGGIPAPPLRDKFLL